VITDELKIKLTCLKTYFNLYILEKGGEIIMDVIEKAKIRLEHWLEHNLQHINEYQEFIKVLKEAGKEKSARYMEEMVQYIVKSNESLKNALKALEE